MLLISLYDFLLCVLNGLIRELNFNIYFFFNRVYLKNGGENGYLNDYFLWLCD